MNMSYQQRQALQWSLVAVTALLAILSFIAAFFLREGRDLLLRTSFARRSLLEAAPMSRSGYPTLCNRHVDEIISSTSNDARSILETRSGIFPDHYRGKIIADALCASYHGINIQVGECYREDRLENGTCLQNDLDLLGAMSYLLSFLDENPRSVLALLRAALI